MNSKIITKLFTFGTLVCTISGCTKGYEKSFEYLYMTSETISILKALEEQMLTGSKAYLTEESWPFYLEELQKRTEQKFPTDVEITNQLDAKTYGNDKVYSLSDDGEYDNIVLYIHGGAYVGEIDALHVQLCDKLVDLLDAKVYMPLYPLAPQYTFDVAYEFMDQVYDDLLLENKPIYIMGDSAGGGFSLAFTEYLKETNKPLPKKLVLFSPWVDVTMENENIAVYEQSDISLATYGPTECGKLWAGDTDRKDYRISPLYGNLDHLPDILLFVGNHEIIYPDNMLLYERATNTNFHMVIGEGFWHVFPLFPIEEQNICLEMIESFIK